jgi:hypothetical protein
MVSLTLDRTGRLVSLLAGPAQIDVSHDAGDGSAPAPDWTPLFVEAGLPFDRFAAARPRSMPPIFADTRAAWEGVYPDRPEVPIRVEAAAAAGRPVYFEILAPWSRPRNEGRQLGGTSAERVALLMRSVVAPTALIVAVILAVRNLRQGRGDRRGAMRLSIFILAAGGLSHALATGDLQVLYRGPALVLFVPDSSGCYISRSNPISAASGPSR